MIVDSNLEPLGKLSEGEIVEVKSLTYKVASVGKGHLLLTPFTPEDTVKVINAAKQS